MSKEEKKMTVFIEKQYVKEIKNTTESLQCEVGGYIQAIQAVTCNLPDKLDTLSLQSFSKASCSITHVMALPPRMIYDFISFRLSLIASIEQ